MGLHVKRCFKALPGMMFNDADYSAAEVRIATWLANIQTFIDAFLSGRDFHSNTGAGLLQQTPEFKDETFDKLYNDIVDNSGVKDSIYHAIRQASKRVVFGIIFGITPNALARQLKIAVTLAAEYMQNFFKFAPDLTSNYLKPKKQFVESTGFTTSVYKFKRRMYWLNVSKSKTGDAIRRASNGPIQGPSSLSVCLSLVALDNELEKIGGEALILVHDSIVTMFPMLALPEVELLTKKCMQDFHVEWSKKLWKEMPIPFAFESDYSLCYGNNSFKMAELYEKIPELKTASLRISNDVLKKLEKVLEV
jgi:DNA polymerase-1